MGGYGQLIAGTMAQTGVNDLARKQQRKDTLTDEQHAIKRDDLIKAKDALTSKLASFKDANGNVLPEMKDQHDQTMDALAKNQYDFSQLYDPIKAPGRLQADWHYLREKIHGIKQPNTPAVTQRITTTETPGVAASTMPGMGGDVVLPATGNTPAMTLGGDPAPIQSPELPADKQMTIAPAPPPVTQKAPIAWKDRGTYQSPGELKKIAAARQKSQQEAEVLAAGAGLSPEQEAMAQFRAQEATHQAQVDATLKTAEKLGINGSALDELKQQLVGLKNTVPKGLSGAAGNPYKGNDGLWYRPILNPDGSIGREPMPPDWKPSTKSVRGTLVNTKEHGWIQTWVNSTNPSQIVGWQKVTPGRQYTGTTSSSSSTDPFGLTTSTSRSTMPTNTTPVDFDLSGMQELPTEFNGEESSVNAPASGTVVPAAAPSNASTPNGSPNKSQNPIVAPPASVTTPVGATAPATPASLRNKVPAPPQVSSKPMALDSTGHIPANSPYNPNLIGAANQLLDGMDIEKLTIPQKAREAAANLARAYGWAGQGMFNPQQKLQIREASTFLNDAVKSPALKVLDSWESRQKLIAAIENSESHPGWASALIARNTNLNPQEAEFLRMYRQLTGTISGLASLTRPGRPTEAGIKRLMFELPNPNESHSSSDAKERLQRLIKEITIATQKNNADDLFGGAYSPSGGGLSLDDFKKKHKLP